MKSFLFSESAVSSKSPTSPDFMDIPRFAIKWSPTFYSSFCPSLDCFQLLSKQLLKYFLKVFRELKVGSLQSYISWIPRNNRPHKHTCMIYSYMTGRHDLTWARSLSTQLGARRAAYLGCPCGFLVTPTTTLGAGTLVDYHCRRIHVKVSFSQAHTHRKLSHSLSLKTNSTSSIFQCTGVLGFIIQNHSLETKWDYQYPYFPHVPEARYTVHFKKNI